MGRWRNLVDALDLEKRCSFLYINGIKDDLRIENLQLLYPNCHAFTDNYRGKNRGMDAQEETLGVEAG